MDRRMMLQELAQWVMAAGGAATLHPGTARLLDTLGREVHEHLRNEAPQPPTRRLAVLTAVQARTVSAAAERIIPRTDTPGATDANVTAFIDHMLANWYSQPERAVFVGGVPELDTRAQTTGGASFVALTRAQQEAVLETLDDEVTTMRRRNADAATNHWFAMLKYLTVYGYCTSQVGMTQHLATWPLPGRYDGNAPYRVAPGGRR